MTYARVNWLDLPNKSTPVNAANLNNMDAGIAAALPAPVTPPTNGVVYWNGAAWVATTIADSQVAAGAAIALSKLAGYPTDATKFACGDGTWAVPAYPAGGSTLLMDYTVAGASVATVDTNTILGGNISQAGKHLYVVTSVRGTNASNGAVLTAVLNNDGGANYYDVTNDVSNSANNPSNDVSNTSADLGLVPCANAEASIFGPGETKIPDYTSAIRHGWLAQSFSAAVKTGATMSLRTAAGLYDSAAAIIRIKFALTVGNIDIGSRFTIYGLN